MDAHPRRSPRVEWLVSAASENVGLKLTSLLISIALFAMVRGAGTVQRPMEVPLVSRQPSTAQHRILLADLPDSVRVTVRGSPSLVANLRPDSLGPIIADVSDGHRRQLRLDAAMVRLPAGVQFVQIEPREIELNWDDLVERYVPLRADLVGAPAAGLEVHGAPEIAPGVVHVTGPALYVEPLTVVRTVPVDIGGLGEGAYQRRVPLEPPHHLVHFDAADGVRVAFTLAPERSTRRLERIPVTPVGVGRFELRPPIVSITVDGPPAVVQALDPAQFVPIVDVPRVADGHGTMRLPVTLAHPPQGVTVTGIDPTEIIALPAR